MKIEYCIGQTSDRAEIIDFLNMVFSQNGVSHDFKRLLPKLYSDETDSSSCHYLVKEDGKIKAVVGVFPARMNVCGKLLKIGHVGSVSVHGYSRSKGYMKELMRQAVQDSLRKGYDTLVLSGMKNRYQYFGFQPAGTALHYTFVTENVRHALQRIDDTGIHFEKITSHEHPYLKEMRKLHENQPSYTERGNDAAFFRVLCSWASEAYAVKKDERYTGYLVTNANGTCFQELLLENLSDFTAVLKAWFSFRQITQLSVSCAPYETEKNELFGKYCEEYTIRSDHSWNILNFHKVAEAFMAVKAACEPLEAGALALNIEPFEDLLPGENCQLTYRDTLGITGVAEGLLPGENCSLACRDQNPLSANRCKPACQDQNLLSADRCKPACQDQNLLSADRCKPACQDQNLLSENGYLPTCRNVSERTDSVPACSPHSETLRLSHLNATEALFSPLASYRTYGQTGRIQYKNWLPLPLYLADLDAC